MQEISERAGISRRNGERESVRGTTFLRRGTTRLGDLTQLGDQAGRTTFVRVALALALAATLAGAVLLARSAGSGRAAVLPVGAKTGVIVADMSASVAGPPFERVGAIIRGLVTANQAMGLVMFSDVGYELLPPNSPPSALEAVPALLRAEERRPWTAGLRAEPVEPVQRRHEDLDRARRRAEALERAGYTHGALVLMSDLNDSQNDRDPLSPWPLAAAGAHPGPDRADQRRPVGRPGLHESLRPERVRRPSAFKKTSKRRVEPITASSPWALLAVGLVLVGLLAANERYNTRLVPESAA